MKTINRLFLRVRLTLLLLLLALPAMGGLLSFIQVFRDDFGVDGLNGVFDIAVSPDGNQVYAAAKHDNSLAVFRRDPSSATLSFVEIHEDEVGGVFGLMGALSVAASPDGRHVYAAAEADDTLAVFSRDASQDELSFVAAQVQEDLVGGVFGLDGASAVAVSPDDEQVFVTGRVDDALAVFNRDATTDSLSFVEAELDGWAGVDGLDGASDVAVSPDAQHVYVAAEIDDSVAVFQRGGAAGTISFVSKVTDGAGGVDGIDGATSVLVSPDGGYVYVTGRAENAVAAFSRDAVGGSLSFLATYRDGVDAVGIDGPFGLAMNAAGDRLLVSGKYSNAVAVFRRDISSGELAFLEAVAVGVDGNDGLAGARGLVVVDDDVYVAGHDENALAVFHLASCLGIEASGDSDGDAVCDNVDVCLGDDLLGDSDLDAVCDDLDVCAGFSDLLDGDGDGVPDGCDVCQGDDATLDGDGDGLCADLDCDDGDATNACAIFADGFESGNLNNWSSFI